MAGRCRIGRCWQISQTDENKAQARAPETKGIEHGVEPRSY
jgi:hypothetical protein